MRIVVPKEPVRRILKWTQRVFFVIAVVTLGYCAFAAVDGWMFQNRERHALQAASNNLPPVLTDGLIGSIEIPRLRLSVMVAEGVDQHTLRRAVGHIPGTALPGQAGNVGISGHRDTYFRPLRNIRSHDVITLTTLQGEYRYRVVSTKIVDPNDVSVLAPSSHEVLTLVTCYPFYFIGSAPSRFIVRAERVT